MKTIVVQGETGFRKVAVLEGGKLAEYHIEQPSDSSYAGNIYKGRVVNVLPGMQAAFVDIGLRKNAFLYVDDVLPANMDKRPAEKPSIAELVSEGMELIVQVKKEALGSKGARITTHLTIPGRYVVLMPGADYIAISKKIESDAERERLKAIADELRRPEDGLIVRTVAEHEPVSELVQDARFVYGLWATIEAKSKSLGTAPMLLHRDLDLLPRLLRDLVSDEVEELVLGGERLLQEATAWVQSAAPELAPRLRLQEGEQPPFEALDIERQLGQSLKRNIPLQSGGYLVIDRTEALTVIDVNTGKFVGEDNMEQTMYETNREAAEEIARLIRLRDWGGIIIVDFIDMEQEENRARIAERLQAALKGDRNPAQVVGWTKLGLLELTRKKIRPSLDRYFFRDCPQCEATGLVMASDHPDRRRSGE